MNATARTEGFSRDLHLASPRENGLYNFRARAQFDAVMVSKYRILLLDTKSSNPNHYICLGIQAALMNDPRVESVHRVQYGNALRLAKDQSCNLFFAFDGEQIDRVLCSKLSNICGKSLVWFTEDPYEISVNKSNVDLFDLVFTNDSSSVSEYGLKARHMPLAANPELNFHPVLEDASQKLRYDLLFVGTAWPNRVQTLKSILKATPGLRFKFALPHNEHLPLPDLGIPESAYSWTASNSEFCRLSNRSRIVLTLHRSFTASKEGRSTASTPGPRLFEVAAAGGFQLVDMSIEETSKYLGENSEIGGFRSISECVEKINYYLKNPGERVAMAQRAQRRTTQEHLYENRTKVILDETDLLSPRKQPEMEISSRVKRPRVLMVTHNTIQNISFGGVEVYQQGVMEGLRDKYDFLTYFPTRETLDEANFGKSISLLDENGKELEKSQFDNPFSFDTLADFQKEEAFGRILNQYEIDVVHFQHLIGHVPSLPFIAKSAGVPSAFSVHDFYLACKQFNLIGEQGRFCHASADTLSTCNSCLRHSDQALRTSQSSRRAFFELVLDQVDLLLFNTPGTAQLVRSFFPFHIREKKTRILGVPIPNEKSPDFLKPRETKPIHVAVLGNFSHNKGAEILLRIFDEFDDGAYVFHIFGNMSEGYGRAIQEKNWKHVTINGGYKRHSLFEKLCETSISLHLSIWPETYCLTLSEAWQAGVVPIVSDIGALGERVIEGKNGFKVPPNEVGPVIELLRTLATMPEKIERMRASFQTAPSFDFVENDRHYQWLDSVYSELFKESCTPLSPSPSAFGSPLSLNLARIGVFWNHPSWITRKTKAPQDMSPLYSKPLNVIFKKSWVYFRERGSSQTMKRAIREILRTLER